MWPQKGQEISNQRDGAFRLHVEVSQANNGMLCNQKRRRIFLTTPKARQKSAMNMPLSAEKVCMVSLNKTV